MMANRKTETAATLGPFIQVLAHYGFEARMAHSGFLEVLDRTDLRVYTLRSVDDVRKFMKDRSLAD